MDSMSSCDIRLVFTFPPKHRVRCSTKNAYTSEIIFLALLPCPVVDVYSVECTKNYCFMLPGTYVKN